MATADEGEDDIIDEASPGGQQYRYGELEDMAERGPSDWS